LCNVKSLSEVVNKYHPNLPENEKYLMMEFLLHGLAEFSLISKQHVEFGLQFKDMISTMFAKHSEEDDDFYEGDYNS